MRLHLIDFFGAMTVAAVVFACAAFVGFDDPVFWISVAFSFILSAIFIYLAVDQRRRPSAFIAPLPFFACTCMSLTPFFSLSLLIHSMLLFLFGAYCVIRPAVHHMRSLIAVTSALSCVGLAFGVLPGYFELRRLADLRTRFPMVSLEDRLRYELQVASKSPESSTPIAASVSSRLAAMEGKFYSSMRREHLEQIHNRQYEIFVRSMGFGVSRMMRPRLDEIEKPPLRNIYITENQQPRLAAGRSDDRELDDRFLSEELSQYVESLHYASRSNFLDPDYFGYTIHPKSAIVGFLEHAFQSAPALTKQTPVRWNIRRIELVSLLKFEEPRVYVLDHLPRMDQLRLPDVPTRGLDMFESESLQRLWRDEDVVISNQGSEYRVLGSLRALRQCLDCHTVNRGDLLGAFSYSLERM